MGLSLLFLAFNALLAAPPADSAAVARVAAGQVTRAQATWWGFDSVDATACLQAALDSGAREVIVANVGEPWIVTGLRPQSNTRIVFEPGVELRAKPGEFHGLNDCLVRLDNVENVTLYGPGATFTMPRADYADLTRYQKSEWRHSVSIRSCRNITVEGLRLDGSGGDGIYVGVAQRGVTNEDVVIRDVVCENHYRQGVSVISAERLLLERVVMRGTEGTAPMAGIDFEPNMPDERLVDCILRDCDFVGNAGAGILVATAYTDGTTQPVSVRFERCRVIGGLYSVRVSTSGNPAEGPTTGQVSFVDCEFDRSVREGLMVADNPADGLAISFIRCTVREPALTNPTFAPIRVDGSLNLREPAGGLYFDSLRLVDPLDRVPVIFSGRASVHGLRDVRGSFIIRGHDGQDRQVAVTDAQLVEWNPGLAVSRPPRYVFRALQPQDADAPADLSAWRVRGKGHWVVHASAGANVSVTLKLGQIGTYETKPVPVQAVGPDGEVIAEVAVVVGQPSQLRFVAPVEGLYRLQIERGNHTLAVGPSSHPLLLDADSEPVSLFSSTGDLWFWVPADAKQVSLTIWGSGEERVRATLFDPAGGLVADVDNISTGHDFALGTNHPLQPGAYRLLLSRATLGLLEDYSLDLRGAPAFLAGSREGVLVPAP